MGAGWTNVGQVHTLPLDDLYPHSVSVTCACRPKVSHTDSVLVVVHESFDGREAGERPSLAPVVELRSGE